MKIFSSKTRTKEPNKFIIKVEIKCYESFAVLGEHIHKFIQLVEAHIQSQE